MREWLHGDFRLGFFFVFALTVIIAMSAGDTVRHGDQPCTKGQRKDTSMQPRSEEGYWQWPLGLRVTDERGSWRTSRETEVAPTLTGLTGLGLEYGLLCRHSYLTNQWSVPRHLLSSSGHISTALCKVCVVFFRCSTWHHLTNLPSKLPACIFFIALLTLCCFPLFNASTSGCWELLLLPSSW